MSERSIFQPKLQELGRIRIGDQTEITSGPNKGKMRPRKLDTFRLTSSNKPLLHAAATLYGGEVVPWDDAPNGRQWQLITQANWLPVTVPPYQTVTQGYEQWSGGGCQLRCDGTEIYFSLDGRLDGQSCQCPEDPEERNRLAGQGKACHAITRLNVLMHELPGIGVWRLDTGGYYAGSELAGIVPFLQSASAHGSYLQCALRLETRQVKRFNRERQKNETRTFPVVVLQPTQVTLQQLLTQQIPEQALIAPPQVPKQIGESSMMPDTSSASFEQTVNDLHGDRPTPVKHETPRRPEPGRTEPDTVPSSPPRTQVFDTETQSLVDVDRATGEVIDTKPEHLQTEPEIVDEPAIEAVVQSEPEASEIQDNTDWGNHLMNIKAQLNELGITTQTRIKQLIARCDGDTNIPYMKIRDHALLDRMILQARKDVKPDASPKEADGIPEETRLL